MGIKKSVILTLLSIVILFSFNIRVYAYDKDKANAQDATDVLSWHQSNNGAKECPAGINTYEVASGRNIGSMGCSYFAASYMLVKMGEESAKDGFTPMDLVEKAKSKSMFQGNNYLDFARLNELYPNITCDTNRGGTGATTIEEQLAWVKGKFNEGYFIIICVTSDATSGHYIFVDGFTDDGDMIIGDSARVKDRWSDTYANTNGSISNVSLFKNSQVKANECPSIYDDVTLGSSKLNEEEKELYDGLVDEWGLEGMPEVPTYLLNQDPVYFENLDSLSDLEKDNVQNIKKNIEVRKITTSGILNIVISFIGLLLCVYSVLLFVGAIFDKMNAWVDGSIVGVLTLGRCKVYEEEDILGYKDKLGKGEYTMQKWGMICIIILIIGLLLISGVVSSVIYKIVSWVLSR